VLISLFAISQATGQTSVGQVPPKSTAGAGGPVKPDRSGEEIFRWACAACHGADGKGAPLSQVGFDDALPDFTDCSFNTPEAAADWFAIAHEGGPVRAFSRRMPAFGDALTEAEIERVVEHARGLCDDPHWPRGDLNFPRALVTEKAFPENEALLTTSIQKGAGREFTNEIVYEHRIGARTQFEIAVPLAMQGSGESNQWFRGLGDVAVAVKRVLFHSLDSGSIFSVGGEVALPTGKESEGLGAGVMKFEPFVAVGQVLRGNAFVQAQAGAEIPRRSEQAEKEAFWRGVVGTTFMQGGFGRSWTPMLEFAATRELERGSKVEWDVLPQLQVSLSKRQHILVAGGLRVPITERDGRHMQVLTYLLWDWFDGGLRDGWR
jgi:mono/diheme cytochrome c family protein